MHIAVHTDQKYENEYEEIEEAARQQINEIESRNVMINDLI